MDHQKRASMSKLSFVQRHKFTFPRLTRGFTLVELMVTIALLAILLALAAPSFSGIIRNNRIRTVADSLQNGLRMAQAEAVRRNRQTVFLLTNSEPGLNVDATANGKNWSVQTVLRESEKGGTEQPEHVQGGAFSDSAAGVAIKGPAAVCFSSGGRLITSQPGPKGADCVLTKDSPIFNVTLTGADHPLNVTVTIGGQVRMCDPNKSGTAPDRC
jgi:type IV fimbrial biogenesis protein FimT